MITHAKTVTLGEKNKYHQYVFVLTAVAVFSCTGETKEKLRGLFKRVENMKYEERLKSSF